jgi:hypothetical protein
MIFSKKIVVTTKKVTKIVPPHSKLREKLKKSKHKRRNIQNRAVKTNKNCDKKAPPATVNTVIKKNKKLKKLEISKNFEIQSIKSSEALNFGNL